MSYLRRLTFPGIILAFSLLHTTNVWAISAKDFSVSLPSDLIIDSANVLSRATLSELDKRLESFVENKIEARIITIKQLDYGLTLNKLSSDLIERWESNSENSDPKLLLLIIDTQANNANIIASNSLQPKLSVDLMRSTAELTMNIPLREGEHYRQASVEALDRLEKVLNEGEDPGPPVRIDSKNAIGNIPTQEQTASSNAFTWVIGLLVVGTIVPMLTWWVFSR
uniref:TPM domain-containing protein n=1 Tax=Paulinella chromatophora TaxID=39717 RepID=B1X3I4_PAUCH|nr:hypothetical protein PCC_0043 [Paulinella chromatophora]ACB42503.1 hypothetical protein PCC_0043 [Paulinella chromatophora]